MNASNRIDFAPEDEAKMASAALWGQIVAIVSIFTAAIALPFEIGTGSLSALVGFGVQLALGVSLLVACRAFRRVARTDDDDHGHLLGGFRHLRRYFLIQAVLVILLLAVLGIGFFTMAMR